MHVCVCPQMWTSVQQRVESVQTVDVRTSWEDTSVSVTPALSRLLRRHLVKVLVRLSVCLFAHISTTESLCICESVMLLLLQMWMSVV